MTEMGNNSQAELSRRAASISSLLDDIAEKQGEVKLLKEMAKNDGFDVAVLMKVVAEQRKGPEFQEAQLTREAIVDTYRQALGLPTTLEDAMKAVRAYTDALPGDGSEDDDA